MYPPALLPPAAPSRSRWRYSAWVVALVCNLPLPLILGWGCAGEPGRVGIVVAVFFVWLLGHTFISLRERSADSLLLGSVCTAALQFFPIVHIIAGAAALGLTQRLDPYTTAYRVSGVGGFVATLLTAALLMLAAWMCGLAFRGLVWSFEGRIARGEF